MSQKKFDTDFHEFHVLSSTFMERSAKSLRFLLKQVKVTFLNVAYVMTLFHKKEIFFIDLVANFTEFCSLFQSEHVHLSVNGKNWLSVTSHLIFVGNVSCSQSANQSGEETWKTRLYE